MRMHISLICLFLILSFGLAAPVHDDGCGGSVNDPEMVLENDPQALSQNAASPAEDKIETPLIGSDPSASPQVASDAATGNTVASSPPAEDSPMTAAIQVEAMSKNTKSTASVAGTTSAPDSTPRTETGCGNDAIFCEDFESYPVGTDAPGADWSFDGSASIVDAGVRGTRGLRLQPGGAPERGGILMEGFSPPGNSFFGRVYAKVDKFATGPQWAHFTIVEFRGEQGEERVRPLGGQYIEGSSLWGVGSDEGPSGDWVSWQKSVPTTDAVWTCLEWEMSAADNSINVWIDGEAKPDLSVSTKDHGGNGDFVFPKFKSMWLGWWVYQANTTPAKFDVLIDDLVLSTTKVGC